MNKKKKKLISLLIIILIIIFSLLSYFLYIIINGKSEYLTIKLNGKKEIQLEYGESYKDEGAVASYNGSNITKNIKTTNNVNLDKIGTYKYIYKIKYKKQSKKIERIVKILDSEKPVIELNGDEELILFVGEKYEEEGAKSTDNYDGDITDKIKIDGSVDTDKVGEYTISYSVSDSSNNVSTISRKIIVKEKPKTTYSNSGPRVAVLNYHFFYETQEEYDYPCEHQAICLKMDKFREQLKWLNDNGYKTLTMKEFVDWMYGKIDIPEKSVLLTIDDGALGTGAHNGNHLIPALEEYKIHATLFLITGWWDISNYQSKYLDVESHTHNLHYYQDCGYSSKVNCVGYDSLVEDLKQSIAITKSTLSFCFPFYESSKESIKAVQDVGFQVAFVGGGRKASRSDNKYRVPRYIIYDSTSLQQFINMVE